MLDDGVKLRTAHLPNRARDAGDAVVVAGQGEGPAVDPLVVVGQELGGALGGEPHVGPGVHGGVHLQVLPGGTRHHLPDPRGADPGPRPIVVHGLDERQTRDDDRHTVRTEDLRDAGHEHAGDLNGLAEAILEARLAADAVRRGAKIIGATERGGVQPAHSGQIGLAGLHAPVAPEAAQHLLVPADFVPHARALRDLDRGGCGAAADEVADVDHGEDHVEMLVVVDDRLRGLVAREHGAPELHVGHERVRHRERPAVEARVKRLLGGGRPARGEDRQTGVRAAARGRT